ncbi:uncharacterized protein PV07_05677 [Cladophialophora immunda]|uniref:Uncharacterized protein n=1 Tax=Cladophialophora immunda TaxID=569365 RepID=A0A0D1ZPH3_9EURO|nr:uncharacterized protein PV07_05677 [Cladophialophora immunda]KIW29891.1 hypothetical protein PV07_05677 [Cladophialophora immunda]
MDPLSLTASIAGLLSLTVQVTEIISEYISTVKNAEQESLELRQELRSFCEVLKQLEQFLNGENGPPPRFEGTTALYTSIQTCHATLNSLSTILQKFQEEDPGKKWYRKLIWSLKRDGKMETIAIVQRCIQIFQFSLTIEGCDVLSKTLDEVLTIRQTQLSTSNNVTEIVELVKKIQIDIDKKGDSHYSKMSEIHKKQMDDERQRLLNWISGSIDPSSHHNRANSNRQPETGLWFLESDDFSTWIKSPGLLWLHGIPGCGKTVLCSTIIEAVNEVCSYGTAGKLAYFYFNFQDFQNDSQKGDLFMSDLLRSLLRQLCANEPTLPDQVQAMYARHRPAGSNPTIEESTSALYAVIDHLAKDVYIILDALDEYPENANNAQRKKMLKMIAQMVDGRFQNLHILATSRKEWDIEAALGNLANGGVPIQGPWVDSDIRRYIRSCLEENPLSRWPDKIKASIETRLSEGANGMFRWVVCQLDMLGECTKVSSIQKALTELPETLDKTYERILDGIPRSNKGDARSILQWLAYSKRPLTLEEVAEAAILRPREDSMNPEELCDPSEVLRICRSLVTLSTETVLICARFWEVKVVRFAHFSVLEYLTSGRSGSFSVSATEAHSYIGECSISVLRKLDQPSRSDEDEDEVAEENTDEDVPNGVEQHTDDGRDEDAGGSPLAKYAAEHWYEHVREVEKVNDGLSEISDSTYRFLGETSPRCFLRWLQLYDPRTGIDLQGKGECFPLYYSSLLGLINATRRLIESGADVNEQVPWYSGALHVAAIMGHYEIAQILLESGADIKRWDKIHGTALECCAAAGHLRVCQLLIDHGANVNGAGRRDHGSAPLAALDSLNLSKSDATAIVQPLLAQEADINPTCQTLGSPLGLALKTGKEQIVLDLLGRGADVNRAGLTGHRRSGFEHERRDSTLGRGTPLQEAAANGHAQIVRMLLDAGADVNAPAAGRSAYPGTALQRASRGGHLEVVRLLLDKGADINARSGDRIGTALQQASELGRCEIVQLLLDKGADVNTPGGEWISTALQAASRRYLEIVQLLLDKGADVNAPSRRYWSGNALQVASANGRPEIVQFLLDKGADINAPSTGQAGTALQAASKKGHLSIVQLLLNKGADVNAPCTKLVGTALQAASKIGHREIVQLLLDKGADVNALGEDTALREASANNKLEVVQLLLDHGADVNAAGGGRGTALQSACWMGRLRIVQLLLDHGADVNARADMEFLFRRYRREKVSTALQCAVAGGFPDIVQLLIDSGADINATDENGRTAVELAKSLERVEAIQIAVEILLKHGATGAEAD